MSTRIKKSDLARDALYEKVNTIADELDSNKVNKSGDTMSGTLTNNGQFVSQFDNANYIARSKSLVKGTTPTDGNKYVGYDWQDKNGQRLAYLGVVYGTNGDKKLELQKLDYSLSEFYIGYPIRSPYSLNLQDTQRTLGNVDVNTWIGNQIQFQDSEGTRLARIQPMLAADGTAQLHLAASKGTKSEYSLVIGSDGYTQCPKPADNSNTYAIATTNWAGGLKRANTWLASNTFKGPIELSPANNSNHGGYIDFHYNGDTGNYTSRIIEDRAGELTMASNVRTTGSFIKASSAAFTDTPSSDVQSIILTLLDKNLAEYAQIKGMIQKDYNSLYLMVKNKKGEWKSSCQIRGTEDISYMCSGNSAKNSSVVTTSDHRNTWYKLGNGLLIQWGTLKAGANTLTFPQPFAYELYYIGALPNYTQVVTSAPSFQNKTTTGCTIHASPAYSVNWIAVGCWYL